MGIMFNADGFVKIKTLHLEVEPSDIGCKIILKEGAAKIFTWHYPYDDCKSGKVLNDYNQIKWFFHLDK